MNDSGDPAPPWASWTATFFGIGHMRPGPGTWASAATMLLWAALAHWLPRSARTPTVVALAIIIALIGIPAS